MLLFCKTAALFRASSNLTPLYVQTILLRIPYEIVTPSKIFIQKMYMHALSSTKEIALEHVECMNLIIEGF